MANAARWPAKNPAPAAACCPAETLQMPESATLRVVPPCLPVTAAPDALRGAASTTAVVATGMEGRQDPVGWQGRGGGNGCVLQVQAHD
ncbi:MAG: hypothetical protein JWP48_2423 [Actinoallomurus sp.]|jgi:hypothetical protein|nr:hypothetical protein [Actinoallomurus sp.]